MTNSELTIANEIAQDAGVRFVYSAGDGFWITSRVLPRWQALDIERRLITAGIETSVAVDSDDTSVAWVWVWTTLE